MINLPPKPSGSNIEIQSDFNRTVLSWNNPRGGFGRYGTLIFLIAWMGGWVMGEVAAISQILKGAAGGFVAFWLIGMRHLEVMPRRHGF